LEDKEIIKKYRVNERAFTRQRKLSFAIVVVLMLRGHKVSLQNGLNKVFRALGMIFEVATASALSQARYKIKPELFVELNETICQEYYQRAGEEQSLQLWNGRRLLGFDGMYLNLPDTAETREVYSVQTNQHESGARVQALSGIVYDLLNDIGLAGAVGKKQAEKNFLIGSLWSATKASDVIVLDRNFADYEVMSWIDYHQRAFVIRFPAKSFTAVNDFWASDLTETIVTLTPCNSAQPVIQEKGLPASLTIRLIKVTLDNGEKEVLGTNLLDAVEFPVAQFKSVYGNRWNEEGYFNRLKNIFEVERFSSPSQTGIEQDFFGILFLATLEAILTKSAQAELTQKSQENNCQTIAQVNRATSYTSLLDYTVELLLNKNISLEQVLEKLHHEFKTNPTRHREGRKFPRNTTRSSSHWFCRYRKRLTA
jgi:hypothetical protein